MRVQSKFYVQFAARAEIKIPNECFAKWNIKRPTGRNASAAAAALNEFRMGRTCELATMRQLWHMEALRNRLLLASAPLWTWSELLLFLSLSVCLCLSLFLTLSISFSPHSTSGRADKAKEGKLCIIMSSLFPYSHVSVCASACVCVHVSVCVASAFRVRVCSWGSYCSHPWGHKSHNKRRRRRKSRPKTLHNFCVFLSFGAKLLRSSFPSRTPPPSPPFMPHFDQINTPESCCKKGRDKNNNSKNTTEL